MAALLEVANLHAAYGMTRVLHGISFAMEEGSITTLLGANGAGKTTTLRALCQMVKTQGEIRFAGARVDGKATEDIVRLGIAHVPDGRGTDISGEGPRDLDAGDVEYYREISRKYTELTGQTRAAGGDTAGSFQAWVYAQRGIPSFATTRSLMREPSPHEPRG